MLLKCQKCGSDVSIHVFHPDKVREESERLYCAHCSSYQGNTQAECPACGTYYSDFLEQGYLACAECYLSFASHLEPLMESYHQLSPGVQAYSAPYVVPSLALARTQELREYVLDGANIQDICADAKKKGAAMQSTYERPPTLNRSVVLHKKNEKARLKRHNTDIHSQKEGPRVGRSKKNQLMQKMPRNGYSKHSVAEHKQESPFLDSPIIESVRLRAARNIHGLPYLGYLQAEQRKRLHDALLAPQSALALYLEPSLPVYASTDDEDHLRLVWLMPWTDKNRILSAIFNCFKDLESLDKLYRWQFHPDYGFLTACPGLGGQALRLSFQVHIPALTASGSWYLWQENLQQAGCEVRACGCQDGSTEVEDRAQISNRYWSWSREPRPMERVGHLTAFLESLVEAECKERLTCLGGTADI